MDHFWSKTARPDLAYEWSNYRFSVEKLNNYKGDNADILDPFSIQAGWFILNFDNFFVEANQGLLRSLEEAVEKTISVLRLNADDALVNWRFSVVRDYAKNDLSFGFLERRFPFIALELQRQNLTEQIKLNF